MNKISLLIFTVTFFLCGCTNAGGFDSESRLEGEASSYFISSSSAEVSSKEEKKAVPWPADESFVAQLPSLTAVVDKVEKEESAWGIKYRIFIDEFSYSSLKCWADKLCEKSSFEFFNNMYLPSSTDEMDSPLAAMTDGNTYILISYSSIVKTNQLMLIIADYDFISV